MNQVTGDLFDVEPAAPPIFRRRDPATSKQAAAVYTASGNRNNDQAVMYDLILENPGLTAGEYGNILLARGVKPMKAIRMPTKRISDLKKRGDLVLGKVRKCSVSGRNAQTYYAKNP